MTKALDADAKLSLINNGRRRYLLYNFLSNGWMGIDDVSAQIAAWEQDESIARVDDGLTENVKVALHHNHLPKLAEADIIEYDARSGDIVRDDGFDEIEALVEQFRDDEGDESGLDDESESSSDDGGSSQYLSP